jgi:histidinol-phosphatase (PHP family)
MRIASTPHAHTTFVDGKSTPEEMVLAAVQAGFVSLGFSEHGPQTVDPAYGLRDGDVDAYRDAVRALREKYADQIAIHLGVERDIYSHARRGDYDYILGACHYFLYGESFCPVDGSFETLRAYRDEIRGGDGAGMAASYFEMAGRYASEYRPDIIAHFDLVKKQNKDGRLYDPDDPAVVKSAFEALARIRESGALLEVNTGGMARGYMDRPYPDMRYLKRWRELGGRVIAGSDCHFAPLIAFGFDALPDYLHEAGFQTAWRLGAAGEPLFVEYPIS